MKKENFFVFFFNSEQIETDQIIDIKKDKPRRSLHGNTSRPVVIGNSKEFTQKVKRAMTENGPLKVC